MLKAHVAKLVQLWAMSTTALVVATNCGGEGDPYDGPRTTAALENHSNRGGGSGQGGSGGANEAPDVCGFPEPRPDDAILYDGATSGKVCGSGIKAPYKAGWFKYDDQTGSATTLQPEMGGCADDCAIHVTGSGYTDYGAGLGFDFMDNSAKQATEFDGSAFKGIQFFAKGTAKGTRTTNYEAADNTIHLKIVTATSRADDEYGYYCTIGTDWTKCKVDFADLTRDGFNSNLPIDSDSFDKDKLLKMQLEFSKDSNGEDAVEFDVWIDNVSFY